MSRHRDHSLLLGLLVNGWLMARARLWEGVLRTLLAVLFVPWDCSSTPHSSSVTVSCDKRVQHNGVYYDFAASAESEISWQAPLLAQTLLFVLRSFFSCTSAVMLWYAFGASSRGVVDRLPTTENRMSLVSAPASSKRLQEVTHKALKMKLLSLSAGVSAHVLPGKKGSACPPAIPLCAAEALELLTTLGFSKTIQNRLYRGLSAHRALHVKAVGGDDVVFVQKSVLATGKLHLTGGSELLRWVCFRGCVCAQLHMGSFGRFLNLGSQQVYEQISQTLDWRLIQRQYHLTQLSVLPIAVPYDSLYRAGVDVFPMPAVLANPPIPLRGGGYAQRIQTVTLSLPMAMASRYLRVVISSMNSHTSLAELRWRPNGSPQLSGSQLQSSRQATLGYAEQSQPAAAAYTADALCPPGSYPDTFSPYTPSPGGSPISAAANFTDRFEVEVEIQMPADGQGQLLVINLLEQEDPAAPPSESPGETFVPGPPTRDVAGVVVAPGAQARERLVTCLNVLIVGSVEEAADAERLNERHVRNLGGNRSAAYHNHVYPFLLDYDMAVLGGVSSQGSDGAVAAGFVLSYLQYLRITNMRACYFRVLDSVFRQPVLVPHFLAMHADSSSRVGELELDDASHDLANVLRVLRQYRPVSNRQPAVTAPDSRPGIILPPGAANRPEWGRRRHAPGTLSSASYSGFSNQDQDHQRQAVTRPLPPHASAGGAALLERDSSPLPRVHSTSPVAPVQGAGAMSEGQRVHEVVQRSLTDGLRSRGHLTSGDTPALPVAARAGVRARTRSSPQFQSSAQARAQVQPQAHLQSSVSPPSFASLSWACLVGWPDANLEADFIARQGASATRRMCLGWLDVGLFAQVVVHQLCAWRGGAYRDEILPNVACNLVKMTLNVAYGAWLALNSGHAWHHAVSVGAEALSLALFLLNGAVGAGFRGASEVLLGPGQADFASACVVFLLLRNSLAMQRPRWVVLHAVVLAGSMLAARYCMPEVWAPSPSGWLVVMLASAGGLAGSIVPSALARAAFWRERAALALGMQ